MGNIFGETQHLSQDAEAGSGANLPGDRRDNDSEYDSQDEEQLQRISETRFPRNKRANRSFKLLRGGRKVLTPKVTPNPATLNSLRGSINSEEEEEGGEGEREEDQESDTSEVYVVRRGDTRYNSFRLRDNTVKDNDDFDFLPPEEEPVIPKKVRKRATKALRAAAVDLLKPNEERMCACGYTCRMKEKDKGSDLPASKMTPELKRAGTQGWKMIKQVFFPSIPAVLQDLWVYTELGITLFAFTFGLVDLFPIEDNTAFQIAYLILTIISIILALVDANIYFFQLGSCARGVRVCRKYVKKQKKKGNTNEEQKGGSESESEADEREHRSAWYRLRPSRREWFNMWFEIIRTIISEILLYPLLIFDMFDFVTEALFLPDTRNDRVNFGLFVVGGFYLILAVYIMRVFMVIGAMFSLLKIPLIKRKMNEDGGKQINIVIRFCIHIIGQILVHLLILVVIGAKIANENISQNAALEMDATNSSASGVDDESNPIRASPFLIVAVVLGSVIPLIGIIMYFVTNYYWLQEFSISFFVNLVSLLQGQGFAETVFGGEGTAPSKELARSFAKSVDYKMVKKQLRKFKSPPFYIKFLHPARVPLAALSCLIYGASLVLFIISLVLTTDQNGHVRVAVFTDDIILTTTFTIATVCIVAANIHVLALFAMGVAALLIISVIGLPLIISLLLLLIFVYVPISCYKGARALASDIKTLGEESEGPVARVVANKALRSTVEVEVDVVSIDSGHVSSSSPIASV